MPGMTGLEMLPKVKAERPNVPVIMITAHGDDATQFRFSVRTRFARSENPTD
jgi:DNA-binding NtrC family response regulator